ncbi:MAG: DUF2059 domain-containing protein [Rhizobiaceae bacterium]|nr:DUF2059 domain-containing protein [Rhizobiaceae bacterium]
MFVKSVICSVTLALTVFATPSFAQEHTEAHLSKAREAIEATRATDSFDAILFDASAQLKNLLTRDSPDQAERISNIVDEEAIALAPRRADLELEAARLFANSFDEAELQALADFFNTPTGTKYLKATPVLARELGKAARIWANGINRDLAANSTKKLTASGN